jgi:allophanate hydrolase
VPTLTHILSAHLEGRTTIAETIADAYARQRANGNEAVFISLRPEAEVRAEAARL